MGFKKGDKVYFSTSSILVNEGKVIDIEGPCLKVETKCPCIDWIWAKNAFSTKQELMESESYDRDYFSMHRSHQSRTYGFMAEMRL